MDANPFRNYYADLNLEYGAADAATKSAFHAFAKQYHPDKTGVNDSTDFQRVHQAYEKLTNPETRAAYDREFLDKIQWTKANLNVKSGQKSGQTRTEAYDADFAEERPPSPRLEKPYRYPNQSMKDFRASSLYKDWKRQDDVRHGRYTNQDEEEQKENENSSQDVYAHGLLVKMTSHPATTQICDLQVEYWKMQLAGTDICIFCLKPNKGATRCPKCQASACASCKKILVGIELWCERIMALGRQFRPSNA